MSLSEWQKFWAAQRQLSALEREQQRQAGYADNRDEDAFRVTPTCPPSTSITFRGGWAWYNLYWSKSYGYYIPSYTVDLSDPNKVNTIAGGAITYTYTFTNAYWYVPAMIMICNYDRESGTYPMDYRETWPAEIPDHGMYLAGTDSVTGEMEEFETAAEAEETILHTERWRRITNNYGLMMHGVILRNNGNLADENQWMPIDKVNRGRSYLWWNSRPGFVWD